jgi:hypothetical protein
MLPLPRRFLKYAMVDSAPVPNKQPQVNGGLYTGEPFQAGAQWANVPVVPDAVVLVQQNLASANPPPGAMNHVPSTLRPGNNSVPVPSQACIPFAQNTQVSNKML